MASHPHGSTGAQLAALEAEERELQAELDAVRASIATLRAQQEVLDHPQEGVGIALSATPARTLPHFDVEVEAGAPLPHTHSPEVSLQPLPHHDPLRTKWQLGDGLPDAPDDIEPALAAHVLHGVDEGEGSNLHLSGTLDDGHLWECRIPFAQIARPEGVSIGRDPEEVDIELPDDSISRRHALLEITDAGLVVTDLGSTNGTFVNEQVLTTYERQFPLTDGMTLGIGKTRLRVEFIH